MAEIVGRTRFWERLLVGQWRQFFMDAGAVMISNVLSRAISLATFVCIARMTSLSENGVISLSLSVVAAAADFILLGMSQATLQFVAKAHNQDDVVSLRGVLATAFAFTLVSGCIVVLLTSVFSHFIARELLGGEGYVSHVLAGNLIIYSSMFAGVIAAFLQGTHRFVAFAVFTTIPVVGRLLLIAVFQFFYPVDSSSILWIFGLSQSIACILAIGLLSRENIFPGRPSWSVFLKMMNFGKWLALSSIVSLLNEKVGIFILNSYVQQKEKIAIFDAAQRFATIPSILAGTLLTIILPKVAGQSDKVQIKGKVKEFFRVSLIAFPFMLIYISILPFIIHSLYGSRYDESILPAQIMTFFVAFFICTGPFNSALYALGRPHFFFFQALACIATQSLSAVILYEWFGISGIALSYGLAILVGFCISILSFRLTLAKNS